MSCTDMTEFGSVEEVEAFICAYKLDITPSLLSGDEALDKGDNDFLDALDNGEEFKFKRRLLEPSIVNLGEFGPVLSVV